MELPSLGIQIRRVRRDDLPDIAALIEGADIPLPEMDRAGLKRFRKIVGDPACDFDVAVSRESVCGFAHVAYTRDLLAGNRGLLLAVLASSEPVADALLARAIDRARRRRCRDITVIPSPWIAVPLPAAGGEWTRIDGCWRSALPVDAPAPPGGRRRRGRRGLPAGTQTCRG